MTVAEGNFDHPVNGQKVNERAAYVRPGAGDRRRKPLVDEGSPLRLPAHIERPGVYRKRLRLYRNSARRYIALPKSVGLSMICDKVGERKQSVLGRVPKQRAHGEVVVLSLAYSKLFSEILEGIEGV